MSPVAQIRTTPANPPRSKPLESLTHQKTGDKKAPVFIYTNAEEIHGSSLSSHSVLFLNSSDLSYESFLNIINKAMILLLDANPSVNHNDETYFFIKSEYRIVSPPFFLQPEGR